MARCLGLANRREGASSAQSPVLNVELGALFPKIEDRLGGNDVIVFFSSLQSEGRIRPFRHHR